jgi:molybdopterin-containing oxidoreductase family membrane subunit
MGAGAGLIALAAISEFSAGAKQVRKNYLILALASFIASGLLIAMDLGNPANLLLILTAGRFNSMMTLDFWALIVAGTVTLVYLVATWNQKGSNTLSRVLGAVGLLAAAALVVVESWMLTTLSAHPLWAGGLTVAGFLVSAAIAGIALALIARREVSQTLGRWLLGFLVLNLVLVLAEAFTSFVGSDPRATEEATLLINGNLNLMFWLQVIVGLALPVLILGLRRDALWARLAALLAFVGVVAEKLWLLVAGQSLPWLPTVSGTYQPTSIEYLGVVGALALVAFLYLGTVTVARAEN